METANEGIVKKAGLSWASSRPESRFDFPPDFSTIPRTITPPSAWRRLPGAEGSADFEIDGERVALDRGRMLRIAPESRRCLGPNGGGCRDRASPTGVPAPGWAGPTGQASIRGDGGSDTRTSGEVRMSSYETIT
jgi:hypothetical protein